VASLRVLFNSDNEDFLDALLSLEGNFTPFEAVAGCNLCLLCDCVRTRELLGAELSRVVVLLSAGSVAAVFGVRLTQSEADVTDAPGLFAEESVVPASGDLLFLMDRGRSLSIAAAPRLMASFGNADKLNAEAVSLLANVSCCSTMTSPTVDGFVLGVTTVGSSWAVIFTVVSSLASGDALLVDRLPLMGDGSVTRPTIGNVTCLSLLSEKALSGLLTPDECLSAASRLFSMLSVDDEYLPGVMLRLQVEKLSLLLAENGFFPAQLMLSTETLVLLLPDGCLLPWVRERIFGLEQTCLLSLFMVGVTCCFAGVVTRS